MANGDGVSGHQLKVLKQGGTKDDSCSQEVNKNTFIIVYTGQDKFLNGRIFLPVQAVYREPCKFCYNTVHTSPCKFCQYQHWNDA